VNDVVFGWLSDHCCTRRTRRTDSIRWGGLIWSLAFVALWFPLGSVLVPVHALSSGEGAWSLREAVDCVHFLVVLCVYDGGLTFVEVNHSALLAELTSSPSARAECNMWSAVCAGVGALTSWAAYVSWDSNDLTHFRWTTVAVALVAWLVFEVSSRYLSRFVSKRRASVDAELMLLGNDTAVNTAIVDRPSTPQHRLAARTDSEKRDNDSVEEDATPATDTVQTPWAFFGQLAKQRNFVVCVLLSALQVFDCTFEKNFFALSLDFLTGNAISPSTRGLIVSTSFILPHFCTVIVTPLIQKVRRPYCVVMLSLMASNVPLFCHRKGCLWH
jgi:Na+/melibiose symporter-like transporter